ncbi:5-formyltetrahydrofolate cyclo-ligase [Ectothiorhodospira mobilis]|uniref:5-formyltetrahydrofolate cyclo-ligase n=1 Tax=Ectothiorhodospira mobilis TaxID=195064 RepID=A0A1I4QUY7_ECTMO|nr:5-formyltetrahydrofolate cyclo-ligase [Ectothiorhodospira mobilis]SFM43884.1 5-formyltetrahydrofolate cyclo-ligase [Ectothiorhodospira mobilis]
MQTPRHALRRDLRRQRLALSARERRALAWQVAARVRHHRLFTAARHIAFYLPDRGEVDPGPLMQAARSAGKQIYLPVLAPRHPRLLWFMPWQPGDRLVRNRFGIPEPPVRARRRRPARHLDLVIAPLVGFDRAGHRLGMGGGFYDTTFAHLNRQRCWHRPRLLGLAYGFQEVAALPHAPWDVSLDAVATERELILWSRGDEDGPQGAP